MGVSFVVRGLPVPQGALVRSPQGGLYHRGAKRLEAWREAIRSEAQRAMHDRPPIEGPVAVSVDFVLPRPKAHYLPANRRRAKPELRADAPVWVTSPPDVDKLERALLDAMTMIVFRDDGQVARLVADKAYEDPTRSPGCWVEIRQLELTR